jgi:sulfur relay (sulfurtransferase) DsrC/TusE family protein
LAFCDGDAFSGRDTFADKMEAEGLIELVDVDDDALDDAFAAERGIEKGGMMWRLTAYGRAVYDKYKATPTGPT